MDRSEHDLGFEAGVRTASEEVMRIVASHIDRLEPGKQQRIREALHDLEGSLRSNLRRIGADT
jgi:enolase